MNEELLGELLMAMYRERVPGRDHHYTDAVITLGRQRGLDDEGIRKALRDLQHLGWIELHEDQLAGGGIHGFLRVSAITEEGIRAAEAFLAEGPGWLSGAESG